jgi:hypothetical protein
MRGVLEGGHLVKLEEPPKLIRKKPFRAFELFFLDDENQLVRVVVDEDRFEVLSKQEELDTFKKALLSKLELMEDYITTTLPSKGDVESECQRLCILNALGNLEACINGTEVDDLEEADEDDD